MRRIAALVFLIACHHHESSNERDTKGRGTAVIGASATAKAPAPKPIRVQTNPLTTDVNGDGHDDAIVVADSSGGPFTYAALDGLTGSTLWKSNRIEHWTDPIRVAGGRILVANEAGSLSSFDFKSADPAWTIQLGERVAEFCEATPDTVRVDLVDKRSIAVTIATGDSKVVPRATPCVAMLSSRDPIWRMRSDAPTSMTRVGDSISCTSTKKPDPCNARAKMDLDTLDWISVETMIIGGDAGDVIIGKHQPGTKYPVAGLLKGRKAVWKVDVPHNNPLTVYGLGGTTLAGKEVVFSYTDGGKGFVTAFALATGNRDWTTPYASDHAPLLSASPDTVFAFASTPNLLVGFVPDTGATRFSLVAN